MSNVQFRLELTTAQTTDLIAMLVEGLAKTGVQVGQRGHRFALDVVLTEDDTRTGQRNGHRAVIHSDRQSAGVFTTAYDVMVGE